MANTQVFHIPMELCLNLVTTIGSNLLDAKRELVDNVINKCKSDLTCNNSLQFDM